MSLKPYPKFEMRAVRDEERTKKEGREILKDEEWVILVVDQNLQVPKRVDLWMRDMENKVMMGKENQSKLEQYKMMYKYWKEGQEAPLEGTDIRTWPQITKATAQNYINAGVRTVEDLADAHDAQLSKLGPGSREMQNKAKAYLTATDGKVAEEIVELQNTITDRENKIEGLQLEVSDLKQKLENAQSDGSNEEVAALKSTVSMQEQRINELESQLKDAQAPQDPSSAKNDRVSLSDAVEHLRHTDDAHWTKAGEPNLNVIAELTGIRITREDFLKSYPDLKRVEA